MNEQELVVAWVRGRDTDAFREICARYGGLAYATGLRILGNGGDAEEIAQESFLRLARQRTEISGSVGAWLHRVAVNLAIDRMRADGARREREARYADARGVAVEPTWDDLRAHVDAAIDALPTKQRRAIVGHFIEGRSQHDLARAEGVSRASIHERIHRGLNSVREDLRRRGVMVGAATFGGLVADGFAQAAPAPAALTQQLGTLTVYAGAAHTGPLATLAATVSGKLLWGLAAALLVTAGGILYLKIAIPTPSAGTPGAVAVVNDDAVTPEEASAAEAQDFLETDGAVLAPENDVNPVDMVAAVSERVEEGAAVEGYVREHETGRPLEGVGIAHTLDDGANEMHYSDDELARTDADGRYRISGLVPGRYKILCTSAWATRDPGDIRPYEVELRFAGNMSRHVLEIAGPGAVAGPDFKVLLGQTVAGHVLDAEGLPVADAHVMLQGDSTYLSATTGPDGAFKSGGFPVTQRLFAQATKGDTAEVVIETYRDPSVPPVKKVRLPDPEALTSEAIGPLSPGEGGIKDLKLEVQRGASLHGRLLDHRGVPFVGVHVMARAGREPEWVGSRFGTTGDDGAFIFTGLACGDYELGWNPCDKNEPEAYGWAPSDALILEKVSVGWGETRAGVVLRTAPPIDRAGLTLSGRVTDSRRNPVADADVWAACSTHNGRVKSNSDGTFEVAGLEDVEYRIQVDHIHYAREVLESVVPGGAAIEVVLDDLAIVSGRVIYGDTGQPARAFVVGARGYGQSAAVENEEGTFRIEGTFPGRNVVSASADGYAVSETVVDLKPGSETKNVVVKLTRGLSVDGTVITDTGVPVSGALVFTGNVPSFAEDREALAEGRTGADGFFHLENLSKLEGMVMVWHPEFPTVGDRYDAKHTHLRIVMPSHFGTVTGRVTTGGIPVVASVALATGRLVDPTAYSDRTRTDSEGVFTFVHVPEGAYLVSASSDRVNDMHLARSLTREIEVTADLETTVDFDYPEATSSIEGRVTHRGQAPVSGAVVANVDTPKGRALFVQELGSDGSYSLDAIPAGRAELTLSIGTDPPTSSLTRKLEVDVPPNSALHQDIAFDDRGAIRGAVSGAPNDEDVVVRLLAGNEDGPKLNLDTMLELSQNSVAAAVSQNGNFAFDTLPDGDYTVVAWHMSGSQVDAWTTAACRVDHGSTAEVTLRLP